MKLYVQEKDQSHDYQLLGRLISDCKYYLGGGYGAEKHLWAKSVEDQIAKMKDIYNKLDTKPEWLTMKDIEHYEKEMKKVKYGKNESVCNRKLFREQQANIEVENPGVLEVPEGKNVEDLPIKHFVAIANKRGLSTVTRALNNLQVWNKNKNKPLSKWAGDMIDKVSKRFENQQKNESLNRLNEATLQDWQDILVKEVYNVLSTNNIYADVYEDSYFTDNNSFLLCVEIDNGDWKHEHRRADLIISELLDNYDNISVTKMKEEVTDDSEDDTYSAIHKYMIIKSDDITEGCCNEDILNEFSSNFEGTEFGEVEFYSDKLYDYSEQYLINKIQNLSPIDINIYSVDFETSHNLVVNYEVKQEDYDPERIEQIIIGILERIEDMNKVESVKNKQCTEDYDIDFDAITIPEDERYEYIKSKTVLDSDGWRTDYTMYYDWEDDKYIFIFGDNDVYDPTNESPDWECDTEAEANEWFDNYTGSDDEEDFEECYLSETNNNTEEQELAEFLDWLKQEKIPVTDVNKKFKMIHIQNPDDLDMASWYLHDRDYFKKLADFGWTVGAPSPAGKKVAKALKMESIEFDGFTYSDEDIVEALAYMYGISYEEVHKALKNNEFTDKEIKRAITYWNLDGYNPKEKQAEYNRRCKELGICEEVEHTYRVWYRPYGLDGDEEDYIDVTASNEDEAVRFARTCGNTTDVELLESKQLNEGLRYYVTDDDYIPLREQPNEGYTELQAIERAQREAERSAKLFNLKVSETAKWYHIMDSNNKIRHDLDTVI